MVAGDPYCESLGVEVTDVGPGRARAVMVAGAGHTNFLGLAHGGALFSLADAARAAASNSHAFVPGDTPNGRAVATTVTLHLLRACRPGDRLAAEATEEHRSRRMGLYRITVRRDPDGELVAVAEGQVAVLDDPPH